MFKNVAQKIIFIAYDTATGLLKTGDAGNLTAYQSIDGASPPTILGDTSAAEISATLAKGAYVFDLAAGETNGDMILYTCNSATGGIQLDPVLVFTTAPGSNVVDKTGYALTAAYDPAKTAAQAGDAMTLTAAYDPAKTALQSGGDVNVATMNNATVNGDGTAGNLWRG